MLRQFQLIEEIQKYIPEFDEALLNRAYYFAQNAHKKQKRASGEAYFSHPLTVALIAAKMRLDFPSVVTALLHDTVEDTSVTIETIQIMFGAEIATLVEGVTKIRKIRFSSQETRKSENLRKFILALSGDIRVLLVKLCDRLHNMRTLYHIPDPKKRHSIATETLEIFAVLASRIGLQTVQEELEDLAFAELHPNDHQCITQKIKEFCAKDETVVEKTIHSFNTMFREMNMFPRIIGRNKTPYSIWSKLQKHRTQFEHLMDIVAFRIILPDIENCYRALGILHTHFPMIPGRFKDYISTPKPNGYRSIHTTVLGPFQKPIEIQIRTEEMDNTAQNGKCSHWVYKKGHLADLGEAEHYQWLTGVLEVSENATTPEEILSNTQLEIFKEGTFCFTPCGDLISLPEEATVIDFAYAIHTRVGDSCVGARIDGHLMPLRTVLQSGSCVEIITDPNQHPSVLWEQFAVTGKAKACIKKFIRTQEKTEFVLLGQNLLRRQLARFEKGANYKNITSYLIKSFGYTKQRHFKEAIGRGHVKLSDLEQKIQNMKLPLKNFPEQSPINLSNFMLGIAVHQAECCNATEQNRIIGEFVPGHGLVIHTRTCVDVKQEQGQHIDVVWEKNAPENTKVETQLRIIMLNQPGSFAMTFDTLRDKDARILNIKIMQKTFEFFDIVTEIQVENEKCLAAVIASLRMCPRIQSVEKQK
ncbi:MAG: RelA/SpoT family protein [Holosporales bacterium]|jgi:GTP pyrophosphokinase|nr:RelA/SpoT family protein [Holosporales bacterium]